MSQPLNILIVGVGGQGTLLTSKVLGGLAELMGKDVKVSELHGMAQRGGSVVTHVRIGEDIAAPIVDVGQADIILAFEKLEALRYIHYLKPDGRIAVNDIEIWPMPVILGNTVYPDDIFDQLQGACGAVTCLDATALALQAGNARTLNTVMLGVLCAGGLIDAPAQLWQQALERTIPAKFLDVNKRAFALGCAASV